MKFGDIYTNGINFWMVVYYQEGEKCASCGTPHGESKHELRPVILDKHGNPAYFGGYYSGNISTIQPYARFYKSALWS